jgi:hypothetical protein
MKRPWWALLAGSLLLAMALGVWMRWALAGVVTLWGPFDQLRHAHSHLGYFGLLFPLAWLGWGAAGAPTPGLRALWGYGAAVLASFVGFLWSGYGPLAIAGSTVVAAFWIWSAAPLLRRLASPCDPLGVAPPGLLLSLACVPPIALFLRSDPALAQGFVSTFLSGLLFLVVLPSALAARGVTTGPWPLSLLAGSLGAAALGVWPTPLARAGLLVYAALLVAPVVTARLSWPTRAAWAPVVVGLGAMALGALPNVRPVALGATHFLILGPVLGTLAPVWLRRQPPLWAWWCGHALWGLMSAALVAQAFVAAPWTWTAAALGGTGALLWWGAVMILQLKKSVSS